MNIIYITSENTSIDAHSKSFIPIPRV